MFLGVQIYTPPTPVDWCVFWKPRDSSSTSVPMDPVRFQRLRWPHRTVWWGKGSQNRWRLDRKEVGDSEGFAPPLFGVYREPMVNKPLIRPYFWGGYA